MDIKRIRGSVYILLIVGSLLDHVTTYIGLQLGLYEANPHAQQLMSLGIWGILGVVLVVLPIFIIELLIRWKPKLSLFLAFPATGGVLRLMAGMHNLFFLSGIGA